MNLYNEDQIHYLCATSDPFISSIRQRKNKYRKMKTKMPEEAYALIEENEKPNEYESSSESDNESLKNNFNWKIFWQNLMKKLPPPKKLISSFSFKTGWRRKQEAKYV